MITNIRWKTIHGSRETTTKSPTEANNNLKIMAIREHNISRISTKQAAAEIDFIFSVGYIPKVASITLEGTALYLNTKENVTKLIKKWGKDKKIEKDYLPTIFNNLLSKCTTKALGMEEELELPFHIPLPKVTPRTPSSLPKAS